MNPLMLLHTHCGWTLGLINREITKFKDQQQLHNAVTSPTCPEKFAKLARYALMIEWGTYYRERDPRHKELWKCYFPDSRPHIYHLLHYAHYQDLAEATGYSDRVIQRILTQPRLHSRQVARIRRFAIEYVNAIGSKSRKDGPDPAYMGLYYALNDPERQYAPGEIVTD